MKITYKPMRKAFFISDLKPGDCFILNKSDSPNVFMKISSENEEYSSTYPNEVVNLMTGSVSIWNEKKIVYPVETEIIIHNQ